METVEYGVIKKRVFLSNALCLGRRFRCTKGRQFGDLCHITSISFAGDFTFLAS